MATKTVHRGVASDYFHHTHPLITACIIFGLFYCITLMAYYPAGLPILVYGPMGNYLHWFALEYPEWTRDFYNQCMVVHTVEAFIGFLISKVYYRQDLSTALKWTLQTFINGVFSLWFLYRIVDADKNTSGGGGSKPKRRPKRD